MLDIGCSKGIDAIAQMRAATNDPNYSVDVWLDATGFNNRRGPCHAEVREEPVRDNGTVVKKRGRMYCVEAVPTTFEVVKTTSKTLGLNKAGFHVSGVAIARKDGKALIKDVPSIPGTEGNSIGKCNHHCVEVDMYSLNSYVEQFVFERNTERQHLIDMLFIDTEGFDFEILLGAKETLVRTRYLEFEYHGMEPWKGQRLHDAVELLNSYGFTCYYAGKKKLWRVTGC